MTSYFEQPCERCGSKKRILKTWNEYSPNIRGKTVVKCAQIVCTNEECQAAFEKNLVKETEKRTKIRLNKEASDISRKANALIARQNKKI